MDATTRSFSFPRWLGWIFAAPLLLGVVLGGVAWQRGDAWKARALDAFNQELAGELDVTEMTLSWWNGFPDLSVDLADVALISPQLDTVVFAKRVGLELRFWSLWGHSPELKSVTLDEGHVHVLQDAAGRWNLLDLVASDSKRNTDAKTLTVGHIFLRDLDVSWSLEDQTSGSLNLLSAEVDLPTPSNPLRWTASASNAIVTHSDLPPLRPVNVDFHGTWSLGETQNWACEGGVSLHGISASWNAQGAGEGNWSASLVVPKLTQRWLNSVWIDPPWDRKVTLENALSLNVLLQPGSTEIQWKTTRDAFQIAPHWTGLTMAVQGICSGSGSFKQEFGAWQWRVDEASVSGPGWALEGSLRPTSSRRIQFEGQGQLDASTPLDAWIPNVPMAAKSVLPVSGTATARGSLVWDTALGIQSMLGSLSLSQVAGSLDGQPYLLEAPEIRLESKSCSGESLVFQWAGNEADIDVATLSWPALFHGSALTGDLRIQARSIHVDPILQWWEHLDRADTETAVLLPPGSDLNVQVNSDVLEWNALSCTNLAARTKVTHNRWAIQSAQIEGLEGRAHVEGSLAPGRAGWLLSLRGTADDISLPKLFSTYGNFGQTLIRHDHLSGALSTAGTLGMSWDLLGNWHGEDFTASLQTAIAYGRLQNLEVFDDVADYLEGHRLMAPLVDPNDLRERLRDVAFEPVSQHIDVRGEEVWLPMTVIESSAMNVAIQGTYDFESNIDYTLGFALRDLRTSASDSFGEMEDDGLGNQFFLRMSGPVEAPEYAYDRDAAKEHRRAAISAEKQRLKDALRQKNEPANAPPPEAGIGINNPLQPPPSEAQPSSETQRPSLLDRVKTPRDRSGKDLLNPDDEDYL